jgi:recombination protein RecA
MSKETVKETPAKEFNKEKLKALQLTLDKLEKTYGKGTIMKM